MTSPLPSPSFQLRQMSLLMRLALSLTSAIIFAVQFSSVSIA